MSPIAETEAHVLLTSGAALFAAGYIMSSGNLFPLVLPAVYSSATNKNVEAAKICLRGGMLIGQLIFGVVGDLYGRTRAYSLTLMVILASTLFITFLGDGPGLRITTSLAVMQSLQGVGIGGIYPSAILTVAEYASTNKRPIMLAAIFLLYICGSCTALAVEAISAKSDQIDSIWRFVVGLGLIPTVVALGLLRLWKIPEANHRHYEGIFLWTKGFVNYLRKNFVTYVAICGAWFVVDASAYGYRSDIRLSDINLSRNITDVNGVLPQVAIDDVLRVSCGSLLGALATLIFISYLPRRVIMALGFAASAILFIAFGYFSGPGVGYITYLTLSTVIMFAQNFGPNALTFIVAAELWCTQYRSTSYGIASACGRLGTIASYTIFRWLTIDADKTFIGPLSLAILMVLGLGFTWFLPETRGKDLDVPSRIPAAVHTLALFFDIIARHCLNCSSIVSADEESRRMFAFIRRFRKLLDVDIKLNVRKRQELNTYFGREKLC
ncbi:10386_t:CDS:2 [Paraglomus occultum]|uniref:10386_t:CDS:1 n=1 Tax=Paraglomus occultum TaxID=144539 RepID=A0A9N9BK73_9GLOM|nr:10386_t:CDS:2 [Paraglomus occultum]